MKNFSLYTLIKVMLTKKSVLKVFSVQVHKFQKTTDQVTFTKYSLKPFSTNVSLLYPLQLLENRRFFLFSGRNIFHNTKLATWYLLTFYWSVFININSLLMKISLLISQNLKKAGYMLEKPNWIYLFISLSLCLSLCLSLSTYI